MKSRNILMKMNPATSDGVIYLKSLKNIESEVHSMYGLNSIYFIPELLTWRPLCASSGAWFLEQSGAGDEDHWKAASEKVRSLKALRMDLPMQRAVMDTAARGKEPWPRARQPATLWKLNEDVLHSVLDGASDQQSWLNFFPQRV